MANNVNPENFDKSTIADLVAKYGSSSATAWLEFERYKIWQSPEDIPGSEFKPIQGYMQQDPYVFAWGNPLVSSPEALRPTARAFINYVQSMGKNVVWACTDRELEEALGSDEFGWNVVSCIYEDVIDPEHLIELTSEEAKGKEGVGAIKDLKKNLNRAKKYDVTVQEMKGRPEEWAEEDRKAVEKGIEGWKSQRNGIQIASSSLQPWLDSEHRRYWIARKEGNEIVGFLILTPIQDAIATSWQIKNAISFPQAPKGTSEALIYYATKDLYEEQHAHHSQANGTSDDSSSTSSEDDSRTRHRIKVTFGISAADRLEPVHNLSGWKVNALSKAYRQVAKTARLIERGEFRSKFASEPDPMYVCYPADGFGLEGVNALLKVLKK